MTKIPNYGYNVRIVPAAVLDDGFLYLRVFDESWPQILADLAQACLSESKTASIRWAQQIEIQTRQKRYLHIDGNLAWEADAFRFQVLPGALRMWY